MLLNEEVTSTKELTTASILSFIIPVATLSLGVKKEKDNPIIEATTTKEEDLVLEISYIFKIMILVLAASIRPQKP